ITGIGITAAAVSALWRSASGCGVPRALVTGVGGGVVARAITGPRGEMPTPCSVGVTGGPNRAGDGLAGATPRPPSGGTVDPDRSGGASGGSDLVRARGIDGGGGVGG